MRATSIIFRRELGAYLRSPLGWVVAAVLLLVDGILFQSQALSREGLSADVLRMFFFLTGFVSAIGGIALSIRLIAEERQTHSLVLLNTSPVRDVEIVAGKFLSALVFLGIMLALTLYMPLLIMVNGKITWAQVAIGYVGLLLLGATSLAIGLFASSLTRQQLVAAVVGAALLSILGNLYPLAKRLDAPLSDVLGQLDLWWVRYQGSFTNGVLNLKDVVFYLGVTYFFLLLAVKTLEAKRWQ
jgi:ABC-2 type transport system permease protein